MKNELDEILEDIKRCHGLKEGLGKGNDAVVFIDDSGRLNILIDRVGWLGLDEKDLSHLHADVAPFSD